jgi:Spy/CpxP family protein refolding chaperone
MRIKALMIILILSLFINVSVLATVGYQYYRNPCLTPSTPCPLNQGDHHLYQSLGLSDAQLTITTPLSKLFHARLEALRSTMDVKRNLLMKLLEMDEIDLCRIEETRKEIAVIQDEIQREVVVHITQFREILNPEQQKRFFEMLRASMKSNRLNQTFPVNGDNK